jgi:hypothetical protein
MNCNRSWPSGGPEPPNTWSRTTNSCIANASYSIEDLDMRRKAEVLQYKKNSTNMSKKQKFSYISNNPIGQKPKFPVTPVEQALFNYGVYTPPPINTQICSDNTNIIFSRPTSSNVPFNPKKKVFLYYDPSVPLTNWKTQRIFTNAGGKNKPVNILNCSGEIIPITL